MKRMVFVLVPMVLLLLTALSAVAEDMKMDMPMDSKATIQNHQGKGTINSVDAKAGKINLTHEPIASLGWPAMTMDFEVQDKTLLIHLKPGQKVAFRLIEVHKGKYQIGEITVVK